MKRQIKQIISRYQSKSPIFSGLAVLSAAGFIMFGAQAGLVSSVSALTYSSRVGVSFTLEPAINISFSSADLIINDLAPGTAKDSNVITVTAGTNNPSGLTLGATVGNNTTYNTTNLIYNNTNNPGTPITDYFTSLDEDASISTLSSITLGKWGYAFSTDAGSTWSNYSGLPLYTTDAPKELLTTSTKGSSAIDFKIAAAATDIQTAGEYNNVINFIAVANPKPELCNPTGTTIAEIRCMQDLSSSNKSSVLASMTEDQQYQLIDSRDEKTYYVAKLKDGNIWMTQNLDLNLDSTKTYTPADTDITANWTPTTSTYPTGITTWNFSETTPESYDPGNKIWDGVPDDSGSITLDNMTHGTDPHYHIGNYYNWTAAVAMNDSSSYVTQDQDANQSICPAGWTLPKGGEIDQGLQTQPGSFQYLVEQYGWDSSSHMMENPHMWESPLYFSLSGYWYGRSNDVASYGYFWSSVVVESYPSILLGDWYGYVYPGYDNSDGISVRCVSR